VSDPGGEPVRVQRLARLPAGDARQVLHLVQAATDTDGVAPLSEHVVLHLRYGGDRSDCNVLLRDHDKLVGYAHLDETDAVEGPSAELVVDPAERGHGYGRLLVEQLLANSDSGRLRLWSHGQLPAATALARSLGFRRERVLWQLRRSLFAPLPAPVLPPDVSVRTFVPGQDEKPWVVLNNRAFAGHPDQGHWTVRDVELREQEPWFDPAGFFLAEREGRLVGFHWTKVHGAGLGGTTPAHGAGLGGTTAAPPDDSGEHGHEPIGEVYVVGVDPDMQGRGLGPALTLVGLRHLRGRGLAQAMLYVDESNTRAIRLYESLGFARWDTDVSYRRE
jgi:mycothiol synthase